MRLNTYAAQAALDVFVRHKNGDVVGDRYIEEGLRALAEGKTVCVMAGDPAIETQRLRDVIEAVHCLLYRADPTSACELGSRVQALEYLAKAGFKPCG